VFGLVSADPQSVVRREAGVTWRDRAIERVRTALRLRESYFPLFQLDWHTLFIDGDIRRQCGVGVDSDVRKSLTKSGAEKGLESSLSRP